MKISEERDLHYYNSLWVNVRWFVLWVYLIFNFFPYENVTATKTIVFSVFGVGVFFNTIFHHVLKDRLITKKLLLFGSFLDIAVITVFVWTTGALESPFFFLYFLLLFGVATIFESRTTLFEAAIISFVYVLILLVEKGLFVDLKWAELYSRFAHLLVMLSGVWFIAYFGNHLASISRSVIKKYQELSVKNEDLYENELKLRENLTVRQEISSLLNSTLNIAETYSMLVQHIHRILDFDYLSMTIRKNDRKKAKRTIFSRTGHIILKKTIKGKNIDRIDEDYVVRNNLDIKTGENKELSFDSDIKSCISISMTSKNKVLGCVSLYSKNKSAFSKNDVRAIEPIVKELSTAIDNYNLYEKINSQAIKDSLTSIYNHGYFLQMLDRELAQAKRYKRNIAIVMVDLDNFKVFNDTYGHLKGDLALKRIAGILDNNVRSADVVARYGGDEFCMILSGATEITAKIIMEKIRKKIESRTFAKDKNKIIKLSCSHGIACYPSDATDKEELISIADENLYFQKNANKDVDRSLKSV